MIRALLLAAAVGLLASSCVIVPCSGNACGSSGGGTGVGGGSAGGSGAGGGSGGGGMVVPANVTFIWTFGGVGCTSATVTSVRITIPGESLANGGVYPCESAGVAGVVLFGFAAKQYSFTIEGFNGSQLLYAKTGTFTVNGLDINVVVDLQATSTGNTALLKWTFPPNAASQNPTCSQAGVTDMQVTIGATMYSVACSEGQTVQGSVTPTLPLGTQTVLLKGVNAMGYQYYGLSSFLQVASGSPQTTTFNMQWSVGGAAFSWTLQNGGSTSNCGAEGVSDVYVNFRDGAGAFLFAGAGDVQPCTAGSVVYNFIAPGTYSVFLQAVGSGSSMWRSNTATPPTVNIAAGAFPQSGANILLVKQ